MFPRILVSAILTYMVMVFLVFVMVYTMQETPDTFHARFFFR